MLKIYLDNCAYNRPFDEQTQDLIRIETEAKLVIQRRVKMGEYVLVWSFMLDSENDDNPYVDKRLAIAPWRNIANEYCSASEDIREQGREYMKLGIQHKDAIHVACAVRSGCDYFITTDKKLAKKSVPGIKIITPMAFLLETEGME